ncbi:MAG: crossover junction endodeoxyribonuclease RuvC [Candidatus Bipolaricaulota bacterium]|nr:crossover junction endodeoxyribonuclease RuvC [Candidatus Bipolaricaulota bacterium]
MVDEVAIGFDPGLATTGYGVVQATLRGWHVLAGGVIETPANHPRADRLQTLSAEARELVVLYRPRGIAVEEVYFATNAKSAMRTAEARGAILVASAGFSVRGYTPLQVKKRITGYGRANKAQVQAMVKRLLALSETPRPDDMADALALALCYLLDLRSPGGTDDVYL